MREDHDVTGKSHRLYEKVNADGIRLRQIE